MQMYNPNFLPSKNDDELSYLAKYRDDIATENNGLSLQFIKINSRELCECAIRNDCSALKYVPEEEHKTHELCLSAINRYANAEKYVLLWMFICNIV
jgi:hypothetical protein